MPNHLTDTGPVSAQNEARARRIVRLANAFDSKVEVPVIGLKLGYDSLLGLIPGIGDAITSIVGGYLIYEAARAGSRKRVLLRMILNTLFDGTVGAIPVLGDLFDMAFRSNTRNAKLALAEMNRLARTEAERDLIV